MRRFDHAAAWGASAAWFRDEGHGPWEREEVPEGANGCGFALQAARLVHAVAPERPRIWDLGAGNGAFAARFLRALSRVQGRSPPACDTLLCDLAPGPLDACLRRPDLRPAVALGLVRPALLDATGATRPSPLGGGPAPAPPDVVLGTYLACVLPSTWLRLRDGRWWEAWVADGPDGDRVPEWRPVDLDTRFGGGPVAPALRRRAVDGIDLPLSEAVAAMVTGTAPWLDPGAVVVLTDFAAGESYSPLVRYGGSVACPQSFGFLAALAAASGRSVALARQPAGEAVTLVTGPADAGPAVEAAAAHAGLGEAVWDLQGAARLWAERDRPLRALRLTLRALAMVGDDPEILVEATRYALRAGRLDLCRDLLGRAFASGEWCGVDVAFEAGRLAMAEGRWDDASFHLERSAAAEPHPVTHVNPSRVHRARGDLDAAALAVAAALALDPAHPAALAEREALSPHKPPSPS